MRYPLAFFLSSAADAIAPSRRRLHLNAGRELTISRKQALAFLADPDAYLTGNRCELDDTSALRIRDLRGTAHPLAQRGHGALASASKGQLR